MDVQVRVAWEPSVGVVGADHCPLATNGSAAHCVGGVELWHAAVDVVHSPVFKHVIAAVCSVETNVDVQVRVAWEPGVEVVSGWAPSDHCPLAMNGSAAHCVGVGGGGGAMPPPVQYAASFAFRWCVPWPLFGPPTVAWMQYSLHSGRAPGCPPTVWPFTFSFTAAPFGFSRLLSVSCAKTAGQCKQLASSGTRDSRPARSAGTLTDGRTHLGHHAALHRSAQTISGMCDKATSSVVAGPVDGQRGLASGSCEALGGVVCVRVHDAALASG